MKHTCVAAVFVAILIGVIASAPGSSAAQDKSAQVERGKYLVEQVARCGDCHSPVNEKGEPIPGKELRGGALTFKPVAPKPAWADKAPNIAGLRGWDEDAAIKFLMTGISYNRLLNLFSCSSLPHDADHSALPQNLGNCLVCRHSTGDADWDRQVGNRRKPRRPITPGAPQLRALACAAVVLRLRTG